MVFVNLSNVCSHLQNASRARLSLTSIPMTKMHLSLCLAMQKQGLFSSVQVGGLKPPTPSLEEPINQGNMELLTQKLEEEPWLGMSYDLRSGARRAPRSEDELPEELSPEELSPEQQIISPPSESSASAKSLPRPGEYRSVGVPLNPAQRRIWLGLKYWNNEPVLRQMSMVSKPTRTIRAKVRDLRQLVAGRKAGIANPLVNPGECLFVSTEIGIMEVREAIERVKGGVLLVRTGQ